MTKSADTTTEKTEAASAAAGQVEAANTLPGNHNIDLVVADIVDKAVSATQRAVEPMLQQAMTASSQAAQSADKATQALAQIKDEVSAYLGHDGEEGERQDMDALQNLIDLDAELRTHGLTLAQVVKSYAGHQYGLFRDDARRPAEVGAWSPQEGRNRV